jgi:hypothetical protein
MQGKTTIKTTIKITFLYLFLMLLQSCSCLDGANNGEIIHIFAQHMELLLALYVHASVKQWQSEQ